MEGQASPPSLNKTGPKPEIWIQANLSAPGRSEPVLILRTRATGPSVQKGGVMRTWNDGKKSARQWADQIASALDEVRRSQARSR